MLEGQITDLLTNKLWNHGATYKTDQENIVSSNILNLEVSVVTDGTMGYLP
jgi:hypothetical protein